MWCFFWIRATGECGKLIKTSPWSEGVKIGVYIWMLSTIATAGGGAVNVATILVWGSEGCAPISTLFRPDLSSSPGSFASRCFHCTDLLWCPCAGVQRNHLDQVRRYPHPGAFQIPDLPGFLLQDVPGHRVAGGCSRAHLPPCTAQLHRWALGHM